MFQRRRLIPLADRGPLRVMFVISSMPVGGAETLLVNLVRRFERDRYAAQLCCLQELGPLGEELSFEIPTYSHMIDGKYDFRVVFRLIQLFQEQRIDAVVTVGAGDKMFWGRIAAHFAGVPVVLSALHSTGWPDVIERPNRSRILTRWTDGFIGVAAPHGRHLVEVEGFPAAKVHVIPNGVDVNRFSELHDAAAIRRQLGIDEHAPLVGIVAALRPEKNHELLLRSIRNVRKQIPNAELLVVGEGPERAHLEKIADELTIRPAVHFLGNRQDIPELLSAIDVFALTSKMEANPVSILEAMASGKPVVAPLVGSIGESVVDGETGYLTDVNNEPQVTERIIQLLQDPVLARQMGQSGRDRVAAHASLDRMVCGYEQLISQIYESKANPRQKRRGAPAAPTEPVRMGIAQ